MIVKGRMNFGRNIKSILLSLWICNILSASEFSAPKNPSDFKSGLGEQQLVSIANVWVGANPQEIAPGSVPLGSLRDRKYIFDGGSRFTQDSPKDLHSANEPIGDVKTQSSVNYDFSTSKRRGNRSRWVGPKPDALAPGIVPLGALGERYYGSKIIPPAIASSEGSNEADDPDLSIIAFASTRPVYNSNVLQVEEDVVDTGIWENSFGVSLSRPVSVGSYLTLIPKLDALVQTAAYLETEQVNPNALNYIYTMAKAGLSFEFKNDISLTPAIEFGSSRSLRSFDKQFESIVPSLQLSNLFMLNDSSILMLDGMLRYSLTEGQKPIQQNDGDNLLVGVNLGLVKIFGSEGQFMLVNSLGLSRSNYLKHGNDGRVDWLAYTSLNLSWQILDWLSADIGTRYSNRWVNSKGNSLGIPEYNSFDIALTLMANHLF